jgi:hypothetical protein
MHAQSVNPLFPNVSLPVREKAVVGEPAKKSEYMGQPIAPAEVRHFLKVWWLDATLFVYF